MAKPYTTLRQRLNQRLAADPAARERHEQRLRAVSDALQLAEVRQSRGIRQVDVADHLAITQGSVSALEHRGDVYLSTLRAYIEALGGKIEVRAVFPDETVLLKVS